MEKQPLTSRQREILDFMEAFTRDSGYPPTVREICAATGLRSPRSVSQHLQALERKGHIKRGREKSRAIQFLGASVTESDRVAVLPLVGTVSAGDPAAMVEESAAKYYLDREFADGDHSFLMRIEGNSMTGAHMLEGDMIVVNPDRIAESGDVVVARIGEDTTVKRFQVVNGRTYLAPANPNMAAIDITDLGERVRIVGRVVGVIRTMT